MAKAQPKRGSKGKDTGRRVKKKISILQHRSDRVHRLEGRQPAASLHVRPGQDPGPPSDRQRHQAAARHRDGDQERPRDGAAALRQPGHHPARGRRGRDRDRDGEGRGPRRDRPGSDEGADTGRDNGAEQRGEQGGPEFEAIDAPATESATEIPETTTEAVES